MGQQGVQFIFSIILARLLLPEQFGLIAMLSIFMAVGQSFIESGFGQALVQKQDATKVDESSIFFFNILVSILVVALLYIAAPWISTFYGAPILVLLTRVLSLNLVISAFGVVQLALLMKRVDFRTQMKISMIAAFLSGSIGISMAYTGFGVWSLVTQSIGATLFRTFLLWIYTMWRPAWALSMTSLRSMLPFGSKLLFYGLLHVIFENLYLVVIGKMYSANELGFYSKSMSLQQLPVAHLTSTVNRVTFPVFSSVQEEKPRLKRGVSKVLCTAALVNFPVMIGLGVVAHPMVVVLLTDKWLPCVPYLQLLCVAGLLYPLQSINLNVLLAQGRSDLLLRLEILARILQVIAIAVTFRWGVVALILGQIASTTVIFSLSTVYTGRLLDYPLLEQIRDITPALISAIAMGVSVWGIGVIQFPNPFSQLAMQVVVGVFLYISICRLAKVSSFTEIQEIAKLSMLRIFRVE